MSRSATAAAVAGKTGGLWGGFGAANAFSSRMGDGGGGFIDNDHIDLYRAVDQMELDDIQSSGELRVASMRAGDGKYFAYNLKDAHIWGTNMIGTGKYSVVHVRVPKTSLNSIANDPAFLSWEKLDNIGPAVYIPNQHLSTIFDGVQINVIK